MRIWIHQRADENGCGANVSESVAGGCSVNDDASSFGWEIGDLTDRASSGTSVPFQYQGFAPTSYVALLWIAATLSPGGGQMCLF